MKRVLVTGGCGFIGYYVLERLHSLGIDTVVIDRYMHSDRRNEDLLFGDVRDEGAVRAAMYGCDGVIHLAGVLGTQETVDDPTTAAEVNITGSLNVFKAARDMEVKGVYIAVGNHWMNNPYSITKTTAERFALMANKEWHTEIAVVRAMNAYGPRQKAKPVRKLMPNLADAAIFNAPFTMYGTGDQIMDMIYVTDAAEVLVRALTREHGVYDSVFEAGSGVPTTVREIVEEAYRQAGFAPNIDQHTMRPGEEIDSVVLADTSTLKPLGLNADTFVQLPEGIKRTLEWYSGRV